MQPSVTKDKLLDIRLTTSRTFIRPMEPSDFADVLAWPPYPFPDANRSMNIPRAWNEDCKRYWWQRIEDADRAVFVAACNDTGKVVALHAFVGIDWAAGLVDTMGVRVRPDLCACGYGKETLRPLLQTVLDAGMRTIRLDVAAMNERAIRCYRACGMRITGETWFPAGFDPQQTEWAPFAGHFKRENGQWLERFYWMET
jgi:RimJ/RimL family protein N-acetyltransferase